MLCITVQTEVWTQTYITTGLSDDWNNSISWTCSNGPCANNPIPDNKMGNSKVYVQHDINYTSNSPISIDNNGIIEITKGASLILTSNLNINNGGELIINKGSIDIGPGVLNNKGSVFLTNALVKKDGNFLNDGPTNMSNSCIQILDGNFNNSSSITGIGSIKTFSGNINNAGSWDTSIEYCYSNNGGGLPGTPNCEEVEAICECVLTNCDILPGYNPTTKVDSLIGSELDALSKSYDPNGQPPNPFIYVLNNNDEVLIEIIVLVGNYNDVVALLGGFGKGPSDFIDDRANNVNDEILITLFFPIANLQELNKRSDIINHARQVSPGLTNTGLINSQGDIAQRSNIARLGWNKSGEGVKIGVISDSYASNESGKDTDIDNNDLPGTENPVVVVQDYPFGGASDEGRAMLQIVHDVAPDAQLFFRTGFISEGNMAAGIRELTDDFGCDIIVDDVQYLTEPFFRDGIIAKSIDDAASKGVDYFSAAGNFGNRSFGSTFSPAPSPNETKHDFGGGDFLQNIELGTGQYIIVLQWDDDFYSLDGSGAKNDLDIYLADDDGSILYGFNRDNNGNANLEGADPIEIMPFNVINPTSTNIMIERADGVGPFPKFKYLVFRAGDNGVFNASPSIGGSTIVGHANANGAITVGAVRYDNTPVFGGTLVKQSFSSIGGTETEGSIRMKPDIMAPNGGNTSVELGSPDYDNDGLPNFFGTSAAAPHAAGVAALLLEAQADFEINPPLDIRTLLSSTTTDMESSGFDFNTGNGFISSVSALEAFSNPTPNLLRFDLSNLDTAIYAPGEIEFTLILEGEYFDETTVVLFRGEELPTLILNDSTASATIPTFVGNPEIWVYTQPLTNGPDGGSSDTLTFSDREILDVLVKSNNITRRYGESNPDFSFTTTIDGSGDGLALAELDSLIENVDSIWTVADASSNVGIYSINIAYSTLNEGLLELYNFIFEPGLLIIDPMPVTVKPKPFVPIYFGDPIPEISFDYIYGESEEQGQVLIDSEVAASIATGHTNAANLINGVSLINGASLINGSANLINGVNLINGEPTINGSSLVNKTFFVSENTVDNAPSLPLQNGVSLINALGGEKLVEFGEDLFDSESIENGELSSITNGVSLINGSSLINGTSLINGSANLINGASLVNGVSLINGINLINGVNLVNGTSLINGTSIINGASLINGSSLINAFEKVLVVVSADDTLSTGEDPIHIIDIKPINVITGLNAGTQYVIPAGYFNDNLIINYEPTPLEILPKPLNVTPLDLSSTYGEPISFSSALSGLQYNATEGDVFPNGISYSTGCPETEGSPRCNVNGSPYTITASASETSSDYIITYGSGNLTVNPFSITVIALDAEITYGQNDPLGFTASFDPPESSFPYQESAIDIFGELEFMPSSSCTQSQTLTVTSQSNPDNYTINYQNGILDILTPDLVISVGTSFITEGENLPSSFNLSYNGLVCGDSELLSSEVVYTVRTLDGALASDPASAGEYVVYASLADPLSTYDNYNVIFSSGILYVNPEVGCNARIKASDMCRTDYEIPNEPQISTRLQIEYTNVNDFPIFVPLGPSNKLKGNATYIGSPPEIFEPGIHTFYIYTDGGSLQWEVKTSGCGSASKSSNGSNANTCSPSLKGDPLTKSISEKNWIASSVSLYPNPVEDKVRLKINSEIEATEVKIYSTLGQLLEVRSLDSDVVDTEVDVSRFASGILYFNIIHANGSVLKRLIKE